MVNISAIIYPWLFVKFVSSVIPKGTRINTNEAN